MTELQLRQRRERATRNAVASAALEGLVVPKALQTSFRQYVEGTTSLEEILQAAQARYVRG
ncbi:antitoxin VbhA family protein [Perlucidibaca piscinae]|uniref:antitoxin VbhA family protein n=1 Tax=Perlucidibaca piscinae TaxID=392589 RepID=UPI00146D94AB